MTLLSYSSPTIDIVLVCSLFHASKTDLRKSKLYFRDVIDNSLNRIVLNLNGFSYYELWLNQEARVGG